MTKTEANKAFWEGFHKLREHLLAKDDCEGHRMIFAISDAFGEYTLGADSLSQEAARVGNFRMAPPLALAGLAVADRLFPDKHELAVPERINPPILCERSDLRVEDCDCHNCATPPRRSTRTARQLGEQAERPYAFSPNLDFTDFGEKVAKSLDEVVGGPEFEAACEAVGISARDRGPKPFRHESLAEELRKEAV